MARLYAHNRASHLALVQTATPDDRMLGTQFKPSHLKRGEHSHLSQAETSHHQSPHPPHGVASDDPRPVRCCDYFRARSDDLQPGPPTVMALDVCASVGKKDESGHWVDGFGGIDAGVCVELNCQRPKTVSART